MSYNAAGWAGALIYLALECGGDSLPRHSSNTPHVVQRPSLQAASGGRAFYGVQLTLTTPLVDDVAVLADSAGQRRSRAL